MTKEARIFGVVFLIIIFVAAIVLCQLSRAKEVGDLSAEVEALYEDATLEILSSETTMEEIEALEKKVDRLNEKWLVAGTEEVLAETVIQIADAKKLCKAKDQVATLFDENGVVKADADFESAQATVSELATTEPEYALELQMQIDEAKKQQDAIQAVAILFDDKNQTNVSEDVTVEMYEAARSKVSKVSNEELKADLKESLELVDEFIDEKEGLPEKVLLDVPIVSQLPELPTGGEITALTMMLNYNGVDVTKTEMADEMLKHESDPALGFVGDPYGTEGYTIYPSALMPITEKYLGSAEDLTGCDIETLQYYLSKAKPIVVWMEMHGLAVHAITLTGYDAYGFFYNDPWTEEKDAYITYSAFEESWDALGNMALSY